MSIRTQITDAEISEANKELGVLEKAFDLLDVHLIITDKNGNILYANKAAQKITGYSLNEMLGKNPGDLWGGHEDNPLYTQMWKTIKEDKNPFAGRVRNKAKNGMEFTQELHITPLLDAQGVVKYFVSMEPDITFQSNLESQVVAQSRQITDLSIELLKYTQKISELTNQLITVNSKNIA